MGKERIKTGREFERQRSFFFRKKGKKITLLFVGAAPGEERNFAMASFAAAGPPGAGGGGEIDDDGDDCLLDALAAAVPESQARIQQQQLEEAPPREPLAECTGGVNVIGDGLSTTKASATKADPPPPPHPLLRTYLFACAEEGLTPDDRIARVMESVPRRLCFRRGATWESIFFFSISRRRCRRAVAAGRSNRLTRCFFVFTPSRTKKKNSTSLNPTDRLPPLLEGHRSSHLPRQDHTSGAALRGPQGPLCWQQRLPRCRVVPVLLFLFRAAAAAVHPAPVSGPLRLLTAPA